MLAAALMLGGLLQLDAHTREQWPPSGAWRLPVGDPYSVANERPATPGPFFVLRGVEWDGNRASHQGADLGCGLAGTPVRAAAAGVVVRVGDHGEHGGYGTHVVLAHRLAGGVLAYSVYAHMRVASLRVRAGQRVQAGQMLGRVGMTGRATAPHLHFELRAAEDPAERWELARVEDPLAFVIERLPSHRADSVGVGALLEWGECAALLSPGAQADDALTREAWWRMVAAAVKGPMLDPGLGAGPMRDSLIAKNLLPRSAAEGGTALPASWREVSRDLARMRRRGLRLGSGPLRKAQHRAVCEELFDSPMPTVQPAALNTRIGRPTLAQAVALIADLSGPVPEPARPAARPAPRRVVPPPVLPDSTRPALARAAPARIDSTRPALARVTPARTDSARGGVAEADTSGNHP